MGQILSGIKVPGNFAVAIDKQTRKQSYFLGCWMVFRRGKSDLNIGLESRILNVALWGLHWCYRRPCQCFKPTLSSVGSVCAHWSHGVCGVINVSFQARSCHVVKRSQTWQRKLYIKTQPKDVSPHSCLRLTHIESFAPKACCTSGKHLCFPVPPKAMILDCAKKTNGQLGQLGQPGQPRLTPISPHTIVK